MGSPSATRLQREWRTIAISTSPDPCDSWSRTKPQTIQRWRQLVSSIHGSIIPYYRGRLIKSLGDG